MNTLTEEELTTVMASGDPVGTWPVTLYQTPSMMWSSLGQVSSRNAQQPAHMAD